MTAENGNGNGELRKLLEIKRAYRRDLSSLEEELKAKFDRELADGKKRLQSQYLENVVDIVFAEAATPNPVKESAPAPESALLPAPAEVETVCPECEARVGSTDKFCPQCASPLRSLGEDRTEHVVATSGRISKRRGR